MCKKLTLLVTEPEEKDSDLPMVLDEEPAVSVKFSDLALINFDRTSEPWEAKHGQGSHRYEKAEEL